MSVVAGTIHRGVMPFFRRWYEVVGPQVAKTTRVCIIGGLYWEARGIRRTPDVDIFVQYDKAFPRLKVRDLVAKGDFRFTASAESRCGVTYMEKVGDPVITYDIVDEKVTLYRPEGMTLADVVEQDKLPLPTDSEAVIMKLFAGADRLKSRREKAVKDFDDAMKLMNVAGKEGGEIAYKDRGEKAMAQMAFESFYPKYLEYKATLPEDSPDAFVWTKDEWKLYLRTDKGSEITYNSAADKVMVEMAFNAFYPAFKEAQEAQGTDVMTEEEWRAYLKLN